MEMTPRQMMAFGELYANQGRANGRQVVPAEWVQASLVPRTRSRWSERLYGYGLVDAGTSQPACLLRLGLLRTIHFRRPRP